MATNLSYTYKDKIFLNNISFEIEKGSIIGLIGTSKSIILNILAGNLPITSGEVTISGVLVNNENANFIRSSVSLLPQDFSNRFITDNVKEEMILNINKAHYQNPNMKEHMKSCLEMVGLSHNYLDRSIKSLSVGEKKLVALANALVSEPKVLLLDEVMIDLDFANKKRVIQLIRKLREEENKTIIIATNDSNLLYQFANKILVVYDGKVQDFNTPQLVFARVDMLNRCNIDIPDLVRFTYLASQKNIKLSFHKDIRDLIKDVYKHVE